MCNTKDQGIILRRHFEKQPPVSYGDADTILDALFWLYTENNSLDCEEIKVQFARLREYLDLPPKEYDEVFYAVSDLCVLHGRTAFVEGIRLGMQLMQECMGAKKL
ncbi:MAG: hypothetical protein IJB59_14610 [Oscillospiraceae bacterium]|nr:hypothetical protein [Oscillospiraceae bacterium]